MYALALGRTRERTQAACLQQVIYVPLQRRKVPATSTATSRHFDGHEVTFRRQRNGGSFGKVSVSEATNTASC